MIRRGSTAKTAIYLGVSDSFMKSVLSHHYPSEDNQGVITSEVIERYGSVRLAARILGRTESEVRGFVKSHALDHLLRYDFSNHNNAKGRRAELYWASLDPGNILEDMNVTQGSQADYDFKHAVLGRVNVKSSAAHRYKAKTRRDNPLFWKISSKSLEKCDYVAIVLYDAKMVTPLHVFDLPVVPEMLQSTSIRMRIVVKRNVPTLDIIYKAEELEDE